MVPKRIDDMSDYHSVSLALSDAAWTFQTPRFTVALFIENEDMAPEDSFTDQRDIDAVHNGEVEWFCARVIVYGPDGEQWGSDHLGGCAYKTIREFYSAHRWQYSRKRDQWVTDPKSRSWKALDRRRPRRPDGSRADGHYFPDMVRSALDEARIVATRRQFVEC